MAETQKAVRLSKVAREFNVGIVSIVEFLGEKGIEIDANPNTKIDEETYSILVDAYSDEREDKEQSKIASIVREKRESVTLDDSEKPARRREAQEEIVIKDTQSVDDFTIRAKVEKDVNVSVVGKIDLEEGKKPADKSTEKPADEVAEKAPEEEKKEVVEETPKAEVKRRLKNRK